MSSTAATVAIPCIVTHASPVGGTVAHASRVRRLWRVSARPDVPGWRGGR